LNFDDNEYFENYPEIVELSFENVGKYFTNYYVLMYHPLPILSFALTYKFAGLNPVPYHVINLLFHLFNILLVFYFIRLLTQRKVAALIVALLFAVHPMNVEAVSWISARSSVSYLCFYMLGLIQYVRYLSSDKERKYLIYTAIFCLLSLLSKANALTFPLVIVLIDWFYERDMIGGVKGFFMGNEKGKRFDVSTLDINWAWAIEKTPFFALAFIFGLVALGNTETHGNMAESVNTYSFIDNLFMVCYSLVFYLGKLLVPLNLSAIYVYPLKDGGLLPFEYYFTPFILGALVVWVVRSSTYQRQLLFGFGLFLLAIFPTLQIIPSRLFIVADRYCYLPYLGFFYLLAIFYCDLADGKLKMPQAFSQYVLIGILAFTCFFSYLTHQRNTVWANDMALVSDIIDKNPQTPYIGRAYGVRANYKKDVTKDLQGAMEDYTKAIEINNEPINYMNRGILYYETGKYPQAIKDFDYAASQKFYPLLLYNYRGLSKFNMQDFPGAIADFDTTIIIEPDFAAGFANRGSAKGSLEGQTEAAIADLTTAIQLDPELNNGEAFRNRGILRMNLNQMEEACQDFREAFIRGFHDAANLLSQNCPNDLDG